MRAGSVAGFVSSGLALLCACASPPDGGAAPVEEFAAIRSSEAFWRGGDVVGIRMSIAAGQSQEHWMVRVLLLDPVPGETLLAIPHRLPDDARGQGEPEWLDSAVLPVHVLARNSETGASREARSQVPEAFLRSGLARACREEEARDPSMVRSPELLREWARARAALDGLARALRENVAIAEMLARSVEMPSPLALLFHDGPLVRFEVPPQTPERMEGFESEPLWRLRAALVIASERVLDLELFVGEPTPVHALGAGIRGFVGRAPSAPERRVEAWVVEARHGRGAAWILPSAPDLARE